MKTIEEREAAVIAEGDAREIRIFAEDTEGANIELLEDAIIKTGNTNEIWMFACWVEGADRGKLLAECI